VDKQTFGDFYPDDSAYVQKSFYLAKKAYAEQANDPYNFKMLHQYIYLGMPPVNSLANDQKIANGKKKIKINIKKTTTSNRKYTSQVLSNKISKGDISKFVRKFTHDIEKRKIDDYMKNFSPYCKYIAKGGKGKQFKLFEADKKLFFVKNRRIDVEMKIMSISYRKNFVDISYKLKYECRNSMRRNYTINEKGILSLTKNRNGLKIIKIEIR
jgi:hypothetical protein